MVSADRRFREVDERFYKL
ncbi:hypothetical protein AYI69_g10713, partial [Smittium culicis]